MDFLAAFEKFSLELPEQQLAYDGAGIRPLLVRLTLGEQPRALLLGNVLEPNAHLLQPLGEDYCFRDAASWLAEVAPECKERLRVWQHLEFLAQDEGWLPLRLWQTPKLMSKAQASSLAIAPQCIAKELNGAVHVEALYHPLWRQPIGSILSESQVKILPLK